MDRRVLILLLLCAFGRVWAETEISAPEGSEDRQESTSEQEWEAKGVIPQGGITVSTQPITPINLLPDHNPYDQGLAELAMAQDLFKNGKTQASSDVALQSYDDLMALHMGRRNKKKRQKLRNDRRQAATVYTDASIAYIEDYVDKEGNTRHAIEEGRARLGDLRDVAQNYPELMKKLHQALDKYADHPSTPVPVIAPHAVSIPTATSTTTISPAVSSTTVSTSTTTKH